MKRKSTWLIELKWWGAISLLLAALLAIGLVAIFLLVEIPEAHWATAIFCLAIVSGLCLFLSRKLWQILIRPWSMFSEPHLEIDSPFAREAGEEWLRLFRAGPWPKTISPMVFLGNLERKCATGSHHAALADVSDILEQYPNNFSCLMWKADILSHTGFDSEARLILEGLARNPHYAPSIRLMAYSTVAFRLAKVEDYQQVNRVLAEIAADPTLKHGVSGILDTLAGLAIFHGCSAILPEADKWSRLALALDPDSPTLKGTRGSVLVMMGKFQEAEPILQSAIDSTIAPHDAGISFLFLSIVASKQGQRSKARRLAMQAAEFWPSPWLIRELDKHLS